MTDRTYSEMAETRLWRVPVDGWESAGAGMVVDTYVVDHLAQYEVTETGVFILMLTPHVANATVHQRVTVVDAETRTRVIQSAV